MNQAQRRLFLIRSLLKEKTEYRDIAIPTEPESQRQLLRGLMNIRFPQSIGADFLKMRQGASPMLPTSHPSGRVCISGREI